MRDREIVNFSERHQASTGEIVAHWLPLFGAQLAIDTTLISTLHCDGSARPGTADTDGAASVADRRRKERNPELAGPRGRAD